MRLNECVLVLRYIHVCHAACLYAAIWLPVIYVHAPYIQSMHDVLLFDVLFSASMRLIFIYSY